MAENDWAKKYLDDLNKKLKLPAKPAEDNAGQQRTEPQNQGRRNKRRRRPRGKGRDDREQKGRRPEQRPPQQQQPKARLSGGFIVEVNGGKYFVMADNRIVECTVEQSILRNGPLYVGDRVKIFQSSKKDGRIEKYEPRQNFVSVPSRQSDVVLAANINQVILMVSVKEPVLRTDWLDRHLIVCERRGFKPVICCSKIDLAEDNSYLEQMEYYRRMGYRVVYVSAVLPTSLQDVRNMLKGKTTVFTGHAGVGKTTVINLLATEGSSKRDLQSGDFTIEASEDHQATQAVKCLRLASGGYVIDTPGINEYELSGVDKKDLRKYFRDFRHFNFQCALPDCVHDEEPGCKVRDAVKDGDILDDRYDTYLKILETLA